MCKLYGERFPFIFIFAQPKQGRVEINLDHRTVRFAADKIGSLTDMERQNFSYEVQIYPNGSDSVSVERSATIYVGEMDKDCKNGKPFDYESLQPTDKRLVTYIYSIITYQRI